jgi:hypothetical protein
MEQSSCMAPRPPSSGALSPASPELGGLEGASGMHDLIRSPYLNGTSNKYVLRKTSFYKHDFQREFDA